MRRAKRYSTHARRFAPQVILRLGPAERDAVRRMLSKSPLICYKLPKFAAGPPPMPAGAETGPRAFVAYQYCAWRTHCAIRDSYGAPAGADAARVILDWFTRGEAIRNDIALANAGLPGKVAKMFASRHGDDFDETAAAVQITLLRTIELFDPSRGWTFSTYAVKAMIRAWARQRDRGKILDSGREYNGLVDAADVDVLTNIHSRENPDASDMRADALAAINSASLTAQARDVLFARYGFDGRGSRTFAEIGTEMDVSTERVRLLHREAIAKLREAAGVNGHPR